MRLNAQISMITLGAKGLERAKQSYGEGLGCPIQRDEGGFVPSDPGEGSSALALYTRDALAEDAGVPSDGSGFRSVTLNYIVPSPERSMKCWPRQRARVASSSGRGRVLSGAGTSATSPIQTVIFGRLRRPHLHEAVGMHRSDRVSGSTGWASKIQPDRAAAAADRADDRRPAGDCRAKPRRALGLFA